MTGGGNSPVAAHARLIDELAGGCSDLRRIRCQFKLTLGLDDEG